MITVWKYQFDVLDDHFTLEMPKCATILTAQVLDGEYFLWALVDTFLSAEDREFAIYRAGQSISSGARSLVYIATFQGATAGTRGLIFHLFERL